MKRNLDKGYVLVGDIGGSKTHIGLFRRGRKRPRMIVCETFASRDFAGLEAIVTNFAVRHDVTGIPACFGIAGPVIGARPQTTNLPWRISANALTRRFGWPRVRFLNDLAATAMALPVLTRKERLTLNTAKPQKGGSLALIAPGTGLGQALVIYDNLGYIPVPSEGGHADFSPNSPDEIELWHYLHERYGHVSIERVLSGPGLVNIYSWLRDSGRYREPAWLLRAKQNTDPARAISEAAIGRRTPICVAALRLFAGLLGAAAGNLALTGLTSGGVYLGGGIPPRMLPFLKEDAFMKAFSGKGRLKALLEKIPVHVILNDRAALLGAACTALGARDAVAEVGQK
jgi:glucokinase